MRLLVEGTVDRAVVVFGASADPGPDLTFARGVTLFAGPVDHPGPMGVAGQGPFGLEALAFAAEYPSRVDRLVLLGTPFADDAPW